MFALFTTYVFNPFQCLHQQYNIQKALVTHNKTSSSVLYSWAACKNSPFFSSSAKPGWQAFLQMMQLAPFMPHIYTRREDGFFQDSTGGSGRDISIFQREPPFFTRSYFTFKGRVGTERGISFGRIFGCFQALHKDVYIDKAYFVFIFELCTFSMTS